MEGAAAAHPLLATAWPLLSSALAWQLGSLLVGATPTGCHRPGWSGGRRAPAGTAPPSMRPVWQSAAGNAGCPVPDRRSPAPPAAGDPAGRMGPSPAVAALDAHGPVAAAGCGAWSGSWRAMAAAQRTSGLRCASLKSIHESTFSRFLTETAAPLHPDSSAASGPGPGHGGQDVPLGHGILHKASDFLQDFRRIVHSFHFF